MGWESRQYGSSQDEGPFRRILRRIFGDGENPLDWALPLYTAWGIRVRLHLVFLIMIVAELVWSMPKDGLGWKFRALGLGSLFLLVLLHEYGHCFACRRVGGTANQIIMWPLGGLASCSPPHDWKANLITTVAGPAVNAVLLPILGGLLLVLGQGWKTLIFNPFDPGFIIGGELRLSNGTTPFWLITTWWLYYVNLVLLVFNLLVPMYPMDAGRIVQELLWRSMGYRKATDIATKLGIVVAVTLFVFGMVGDSSRLTAIALFGGLTCWMERRRLAMSDDLPAMAAYDFERGYRGMSDEDEPDRRAAARERQRKKDEADQAELDRILAKIAQSGMGSLTRSEKRWLERATERRRSG